VCFCCLLGPPTFTVCRVEACDPARVEEPTSVRSSRGGCASLVSFPILLAAADLQRLLARRGALRRCRMGASMSSFIGAPSTASTGLCGNWRPKVLVLKERRPELCCWGISSCLKVSWFRSPSIWSASVLLSLPLLFRCGLDILR